MPTADTMCERCDGLCCRVYDIFDSNTGKHIKQAGQKCGYLDIKNRCRIYKKWKGHLGFQDVCSNYDCMEAGPIVTIFSRRLSEATEGKSSILSSLLETIRIAIVNQPHERRAILDFAAKLLNEIKIDESLSLSVKVARIKIERWERVG
ncbi:MAG: hypothetical protein HHAS10_05820 [Candidatus Altimarinota bacterium]